MNYERKAFFVTGESQALAEHFTYTVEGAP